MNKNFLVHEKLEKNNNIMENDSLKYYTPELNEFHLGFEYELRTIYQDDDNNTINKWYKLQTSGELSLSSIKRLINDIRVKFLDKEDIESLNFYCNLVFTREDMSDRQIICDKIVKYRKDSQSCNLIYNPISNWLLVSIKNQTIFAGFCKNKSELKRLMGQLNIQSK